MTDSFLIRPDPIKQKRPLENMFFFGTRIVSLAARRHSRRSELTHASVSVTLFPPMFLSKPKLARSVQVREWKITLSRGLA